MRRLGWSSEHSVYLPELDEEHRGLFQIADELRIAIQAGGKLEQIQTLTCSLIRRAESHFLHEQQRMRAARYPALAWHTKQHDAVRRRAQQVVKRLEAGESEAAMELVEFLAGWLADHTGVADRMMAAYLRNHDRLRSTKSS